MNGAIRRELDKLNEAPMASGDSRRVLFEADESAALARLPTHPWEWGEWETRKVARNCHVAVELNYYSIPSAHIGRKVEVRMSERMIEVFLQRGGERIAVHRRMKGKNNYATRGEHMPKRLKAVQHIRSPDYGPIRRFVSRFTLRRNEGETWITKPRFWGPCKLLICQYQSAWRLERRIFQR